jgi:hypothetical protein
MQMALQSPPGIDAAGLAETRARVRSMLLRSPSFLALPPDERRRVAHDTVNVFHFLGDQAPYAMIGPRAARAMAVPDRLARAQADGVATNAAQGAVTARDPAYASVEPPPGAFRAGAAREGAAVAGALLQSVSFVEFVGGLIQNVYVAIVDASIKQMQAYAEMVASVAKSVDEFKNDNISANQGRDYVVDQFPDLFDISAEGDFFGEGKGEPRVVPREGVDERAAAERVNRTYNLTGEQALRGLDSDTLEKVIVPAAQMQLALSRQRLLATTLLMGLQKIVVTDGRISAKVMYNFRSKDVSSSNVRAVNYDYGDQMKTTRAGNWDSGDDGYEGSSKGSGDSRESSFSRGKRWSKGEYQSVSEPVIEMQSVSTTQTMGSLETTAALAGSVDINFKTESVDLNRIADSIQMSQLQGAAGMLQAAQPLRASPGTAASQPPPAGQAPAPAPAPAPAT